LPACTPSSSRSPARPGARSRATAAASLLALAVLVTGCGGGSSSPAAGSSSGTGAVAPMPTTVKLGKVAGNLHQPNKKVFAQHRKQLLTAVGQAADTWIDGGFVGVDYPRDDFGSAFRAFTPAARKDATHQQALMTNWPLRRKIDGVDVRKRTVTVDVLAPHGRPAGVTARVDLVFTTTGDTKTRVAVTGRLLMSPGAHGAWQVFGYDISKGGR
jgi:hypothetical protein